MYTHGYRLQRKILFSFYVDIARVSLHFPKSEPLTVLEKKNLVCAKRYMKLRSRIRIKRFANNLKHCADDSLLTRCRYCVFRRTKQSPIMSFKYKSLWVRPDHHGIVLPSTFFMIASWFLDFELHVFWFCPHQEITR